MTKVVGLALVAAGVATVVLLGINGGVEVGEIECGRHGGRAVACDEGDALLSGVVPYVVGVPVTLVGLLVLLAGFTPRGATINLRPWRR